MHSNHSRITPRALILGICLVVLVVGIVSYAELVIANVQIGFLQFPPVVIGLFFFLVIGNRLVQPWIQRLALSQQELMLVYCMMVIASMISSRGLMEKLLPVLVSVNYFANPTNNWAELFFPHIKPWLVPFDPEVLAPQPISVDFYEQIDDLGSIPWQQWTTPVLIWGLLALLIFFAYLCLALVLRQQWIENEKLSFPLTQLPLEFASSGRNFFRHPYVWLGFSIPALIFSLNGLHQIFPQIPSLSLRYLLNRFFTEKPWNAISYTPLFLSFAAVGFFYLLPTQLLFSLWFFFWLTRLQDIIAALLGLRVSGMPLYPTRLHIGYQVAGAYCVLVISYLYTSWPYLKQRVLGSLFSSRQNLSDQDQLLPVAAWGFILSLTGAAIWLVWAGMSPIVAIFEILIVVGLVAIVMARSTAEAGMLMTETSFRPIDMYQLLATKSSLGAKNLTILSFFDAIFARDLRGLVLTGFLDGLKISDGVKLDRRSLLLALTIAILIAFCCAALVQTYLPYKYGGNYMYSYAYKGNSLWAFRDNISAIEGFESGYNFAAPIFFGLGLAVTTILVLCRMAYWWWPLQPLGYALSGSWTLIVFWFPILIAWITKSVVLRLGGIQKYRQFRPFFLGLIFGEFSMAVVWTLISYLTRASAPFFPWP